jgi:flagellar M-ring protein FliF
MMRVALQNELSKMIRSLNIINEATVVIDGGKKKVLGPQIRPRATVKVTTKRGSDLKQDTAESIIALVSYSMAGMEKKNVVVVDQNARHFYARDDDSTSAWSVERLAIQRREEEFARTKVEQAVRQFYPGAEAFAFVNIEFDLDRKGTETVEILEGAVKRKNTSKQNHQSVDSPPAEVGANPNITRAANTSGGGKRTTSSIKTADVHMENGKRMSHHQVAPGDVREMTVSLVMHLPPQGVKDGEGNPAVDDTGRQKLESAPKLSEEDEQRLAAFIAKGVGLKSVRDVSIRQVEWRPVEEPEIPEEPMVAVIRRIVIKNLSAIVLVGLAVAGLVMIWAQVRRVIPADDMDAYEDELATPIVSELDKVSEEDKANANFEQMRNKIADLVAEDPKKAASLVKRWLIME